MKNIITAALFASTLLIAQNYTAEATHTAESKQKACNGALQNAKVDAMEQAGTLVFSRFNSSVSDTQGKISKSNQHKLTTAALGIAKLQSKKEDVSVGENYQFTCSVNAVFEIDQGKMEKTLAKMIENQEKGEILSGYFEADGYSEEGQSKYQAYSAATLIAQRNLLDVIVGADITSLTTVSEGEISSDKIAKIVSGKLRGAQVVKKEYNDATRSAYVVLRIKKSLIVDSINDSI